MDEVILRSKNDDEPNNTYRQGGGQVPGDSHCGSPIILLGIQNNNRKFIWYIFDL